MRVAWLLLLLCVAAARTVSLGRQKQLQAQVHASHKANANTQAQIEAAVNALLEETDQLSILVASDAQLKSLAEARINNQQSTETDAVAPPPYVLRSVVLNTGKGNKGRVFAHLQNDFAVVASSNGVEFVTSRKGPDALQACGVVFTTSISRAEYKIGIETAAQDKATKVVNLLRAGRRFNVNYASYSFGVVNLKCDAAFKFYLHQSVPHLNQKLLDQVQDSITSDCVSKFMSDNRLERDHFNPKAETGRFYTVVDGHHYVLDCSVSTCEWIYKYDIAEVAEVFAAFYLKHEPDESKDRVWMRTALRNAQLAVLQGTLSALYEQLHAKYQAMPERVGKQGVIFEKLKGRTANANEYQYRYVSGARGGRGLCLDRKSCHWGTSDARLSSCAHCGAVGWSLSDDGKLANHDGRNCLIKHYTEATIAHCNDNSPEVKWQKVGPKKVQAALAQEAPVPSKTELVLENPIVKKCQKDPAKWTAPLSARPMYNGVVLLDTRHHGNGPNPAEELATKLLTMNYQSMTADAQGKAIDGKRWMSGIADATKVYDLVIPGSHDTLSFCVKARPTDTHCDRSTFLTRTSATAENFGLYITQDWDLTEQLERGLRWFDLRLVIANDVLYGSHDGYAMKTSIKHALRQMITFLTKNPREFLFATFKVEQGAVTDFMSRKSYWNTLYKMAMNELSAEHPQLADEARGKIVAPLVTYADDSGSAKSEVESSVLEGLVNAVRGKLYLVLNDIDGGLVNGLPQNIPADVKSAIERANKHSPAFKW